MIAPRFVGFVSSEGAGPGVVEGVSVTVTMVTDPLGRVEDDCIVEGEVGGGGGSVGLLGGGGSGVPGPPGFPIVEHDVPKRVANSVRVNGTVTVTGFVIVVVAPAKNKISDK